MASGPAAVRTPVGGGGGRGEHRQRQKTGGCLEGGRVRVVPAVRGQEGEPGVDVLRRVRPSAAGEFVPSGFVALAGFGLLQRAQLA